MYVVVLLGIGAMGSGLMADAFPVLGAFLFPVAVVCGVGFVAAFIGPAEKLFPLRTLPRRVSPELWGWIVYILKVLLFFGTISAVLYILSRSLQRFL